MNKCLILLCFLVPSVALGGQFTDEQSAILRMAQTIGAEIGYPETLQAIALQETHAGHYGNRIGDVNEKVGKRSYGIMQVKVATARFVFNNFKYIKDQYFGNRKIRNIRAEEIIVLLMSNDEACMEIAALNFKKMLDFAGGEWSRAVAAYNGGWGVAKKLQKPRKFGYVRHINKRIRKEVRPFNKQFIVATSN